MALNPFVFQIELPSDLIPVLDQLGTGKTTDERVKISIAIGLYTGNVISLARAAEVAGRSLGDFIDILRQRNISWVQYGEEELRHDVVFSKRVPIKPGDSNDESRL